MSTSSCPIKPLLFGLGSYSKVLNRRGGLDSRGGGGVRHFSKSKLAGGPSKWGGRTCEKSEKSEKSRDYSFLGSK